MAPEPGTPEYYRSCGLSTNTTGTVTSGPMIQPDNIKKRLIGYECVKSYPGVSKGYKITVYDDGTWMMGAESIGVNKTNIKDFIEFWKPIYEKVSEVLMLGTGNVLIEVSKDKIMADGKNWDYAFLQKLISVKQINNRDVYANSWTIGCSTFTSKDIIKILETYYKFNRKLI